MMVNMLSEAEKAVPDYFICGNAKLKWGEAVQCENIIAYNGIHIKITNLLILLNFVVRNYQEL